MRRIGITPIIVGIGLMVGVVATFAWGAILSRAESAPNCRTYSQTGHQICGKFLTYWDAHGGLAQQGYPISDEFIEYSDLDGRPYTVQYFERAVFEYHPENKPPYDVLLSQLGTFRAREKYPKGFPQAGQIPFYEDRTDPAAFLQSFYNAINRKEYQRAYSYFDQGADKPTYDKFVQGYKDTASVTVYTGKVTTDAGAGNVYASVPTVLVATHTDNTVHTFYGCYILHHTNPGIDPDPNAALWKISRATIAEDKANTPVATLLARPCAP
jgi:hypothetical protein